MGNPTTPRRLGNSPTVIDKNGNLILEFNIQTVDPYSGKNVDSRWETLHNKLKGETVLNIGGQKNLAEATEGIVFTAVEMEAIQALQQKRTTWSYDDTQNYINDLFNRLINNPLIDAEMDTTVNKEQWELAIVNSIIENLLAPTDATYLTDYDRYNETIGENYLDELLFNEFNFLTNQGKQDSNYLFSRFRVAATIDAMKNNNWIDEETFARTLGFDKLLDKANRIGFDALLPEEQETYNFVINMYSTDGERMQLISKENSGSSYEKITESVLKSVSEDDRLNNKNDAKLFPAPLSEIAKQNEEARLERGFNLWGESAGLEKAIRNVDPTRFVEPSGNNIKQGILNNALSDVVNSLVLFRINVQKQNPGLSKDDIERATYDQYQRMIAEPPTSYFQQELQDVRSKAIIDTFIDSATLKYAKNNPTSYYGLTLTEAGILSKEIPQEIKDSWVRNIPNFINIDQIDDFIGDKETLENYVLAAKNQALADNNTALKSLAQSFLGITNSTSEEMLEQLGGKGKAVDQIASMLSTHYSTNLFEKRSTEDILNELKKVYGLTPDGTFVKKRALEEVRDEAGNVITPGGTYSRIPGSFVSQGDETLGSADDPNMFPPSYFDDAVKKHREAVTNLDPTEQARQQIDERRIPVAPSAFGLPAFPVVPAMAPITNEDILKNLQVNYSERPEFLKFLLPNIEMLKKEFYKTQTPTAEQAAASVDAFAKQQVMKEFEKTRPKSLGQFLSAELPGDLNQQFKFTNLFKQQEERLASEQQAIEDVTERKRRQQLISKPVTIFRRRSR